MENGPVLGQLIKDADRRRDAVHIAVVPVTADQPLSPGQHVGLTHPDSAEMAGPCDNNIGIVDPFLVNDVKYGERFWLFLYPGTITSLRHVWTHPAFGSVAAAFRDKVP